MAADRWPVAGQRIEVHVDASSPALLAVVDDVRAPAQLHLREPVQQDGRPAPAAEPGTWLRLTWTTDNGYHELPAVLVALPVSRTRLWKLSPDDIPRVVQRREFVRAPDVLGVQLARGQARWAAVLCDLSEGGARCVVTAHEQLQVGEALVVHLQLEGRAVAVHAVLLALEPLPQGRAAVRLRFDGLRRDADLVRRRVLEQQRRMRATLR